MKKIEILEKAAENGTSYKDINVNSTFGAAYFTARRQETNSSICRGHLGLRH